MSGRPLRCAIYTRKSTEEGLEQDFNSLDAQREACEAYIKSQRGEGWRLIATRYDDGGISGGTMERPALQQLLADIRARKVNTVVVYKVDRLTRSLADFAKIVEVFDDHDVSFVSVTQSFNTTTSMGRLTLNMLLSFAQFEREVTGERIRDKIAASKKKGMWMGGVVPLGYDVVERKLIVNQTEAATVRKIFELYQQYANTRCVKEAADRLGLRTKSKMPNNQRRPGGTPFTRGHIHTILVNRLYIGEITHKVASYPGEHAPIIDRALWDSVQAQLACNAVKRRHGSNTKHPSLLAGLLHDGEGRPMAPSHATKADRRYRYYVSRLPEGAETNTAGAWRLPAPMIENVVLDEVLSFLGDKVRLSDKLRLEGKGFIETLACASRLADQLQKTPPADRRTILADLIERIDVKLDRVRIALRPQKLRAMLGDGATRIDEVNTQARVEDTFTLETPVSFKRRGVELKLVINGDRERQPVCDPNLIAVVAQGYHWFEQLRDGAAHSVRDVAQQHGINQADVSRIIPLGLLAPDIVTAILDGHQPVELTVKRLKRAIDLPVSWAEQRRVLGFV